MTLSNMSAEIGAKVQLADETGLMKFPGASRLSDQQGGRELISGSTWWIVFDGKDFHV